MASNNIARLGVVLGIDTSEFTANIDKAISENRKLGMEIKRSSNAAAAEIIALKYATDDYGKSLSKVEQVQREIDSGRFAKAEQGIKDQLLATARAYDAKAASMKHVNTALTDQQKLQLSYQTTDLITQIASGQNAMIALLQQGGQLKDSMGGLGNMFRLLGTFITPLTVGLTAIGTAAAAAAYGFYKGWKESKEFQNALILTGNYAAVTQSQLQSLSTTVSDNLNISITDTKDIFSTLLSTGRFTADSMGSVGQAIALISKYSGESAKDVAAKLIPSFDGSASSAKKLNDTYHFLSIEQYKQIELLEKQNEKQKAIKLTADALNESLQNQEVRLGTVEKIWTSLVKLLGDAKNLLFSLGKEPDVLDEMVIIAKQIEKAQKKMGSDNALARQQGEEEFAAYMARYNLLKMEYEAKQQVAINAQVNEKKIANEEKYGEKSRNNFQELEKLKYKYAIDQAKIAATEEQKAELEFAEKTYEARQEMIKKNREEGGMLALQNLQIFEQKRLQFESEKNQKIKEINAKRIVEEQEERNKIFEEENAYITKRNIERDQAYESQEKSLRISTDTLNIEKQRIQEQSQMIGLTETQVKLIDLRYETMKKIADIDRQVDEGKLRDRDAEMLKRQVYQQEEAQKLIINLGENLKLVNDISNSVFNNMGNAIDNFVKTGKFSFKDFARSVIQDIIAIQMKAQATKLLGGLFSSFSFGSKFGGADVGGIGAAPYADGGDPTPNQVALVGEKGPELFVPRTAGTIIPNHQLAGAMGGTTVNNFSINAIDTKSFEDRLLNSPNAVWAANQYASKSLAFTKGRA